MTQAHSDWITIDWQSDMLSGQRLRDGRQVAQARAATRDALLTTLDAGPDCRVMHLGAPQSTSRDVPAPILDRAEKHGGDWHLPALNQAVPPGRLGAARLRIAGFRRLNPDWDGVLCLPEVDATHWVQISADEIVSFQAFSTGKLVACLVEGVSGDVDAAARAETFARPERLAAHLRSAEVAGRGGDAVAGHLIGAEMAASRAYWLGQQVALIGVGALAEGYAAAMRDEGVPLSRAAPDAMTLEGLEALTGGTHQR